MSGGFQNTQERQRRRKGILREPLGEQIWFSGGVGRCAGSLCQDPALGVWYSLVSRVKGTLMESEMLGKTMSDPSRYLNNIL